jgi:trimeric autotransporter adhesin
VTKSQKTLEIASAPAGKTAGIAELFRGFFRGRKPLKQAFFTIAVADLACFRTIVRGRGCVISFILCFSLIDCAESMRVTERADSDVREEGSKDDSVTSDEGGSETTADGGRDAKTTEGGAADENSKICPDGYQPNRTGECRDIDECAQGLDTCDHVPEACVNQDGGFACSCPSGFTGDGQGEQGCVPVLLSLEVSSGVLDPSFTSETTQYAVDVTLSTETMTVTPSARAEVMIEVEGIKVESGSSSSPITLDLGANQIEVRVSYGNASRDYLLNVNRGFTYHYLKASNGAASNVTGNQFAAVSLYGDTLAVGAAYESSGSTGINGDQENNDKYHQSGAVYVFTRNGTRWSQQAYIKASNTDAADYFGVSVSLYGDTLAVGALFESSNATGVDGDQYNNDMFGRGAVYVFVREGTTWSQQAYLKASNTDGTDSFFGHDISLYEDTLAIGAVGESSNATGVDGDQDNTDAEYSGAVYVFTRDGERWRQQAYLKASNTDAGDTFGYYVSLYGETLAVGAPSESSNATGIDGDQDNNDMEKSGAVYVFTREGTTWSQQAYIKASNTDPDDSFGTVSLYGDTLAVGAPGESSNATGVDGDEDNNDADKSGAVYIFTRDGKTWSQRAYLKTSNTDAQDGFGNHLSLYRDTLVAAAPYESSAATLIDGDQNNNDAEASGAVYLFKREGTRWSQQEYVKASNTDANDNFGSRVSLYEDTFAVGALGEKSNATGVDGDQSNNDVQLNGAVYVFR